MAKDVEVWKGIADEYGLVEPTFGARPRPAHGSRLEPADRSDDGHGAQPGAGLSCIPEHGGPFLDLLSGLRADGIIP